MPVELLIIHPPDETRRVPIAFDDVFTDYWQRACSELGLERVPLFQSGLEIGQDMLPVVLDELSRLKRWMDFPGRAIPIPVREYILKRISNLISELEKLRGSTAEIFIDGGTQP